MNGGIKCRRRNSCFLARTAATQPHSSLQRLTGQRQFNVGIVINIFD